MQLDIQDIVNSIVNHESNAGAVLNTSKELLLLIEEETDKAKQLSKLYRGKLTSSEVEVLKQKFEILYKQLQEVLTNVGLYKNELMLREKMNAAEVEPEKPKTDKEQFNKEFDDAFDFKSNDKNSENNSNDDTVERKTNKAESLKNSKEDA